MNIVMITQLVMNLFLLSSGVLLLLISLILRVTRLYPVRRLVFLSLFIFSCSLWFLIHNPILGLEMEYRRIFELADMFCQYGITFFAITYAGEFVNQWRKKLLRACQIWTILFVTVIRLLQICTGVKYTDFLFVGALCNAVFIIIMGICIGWEAFREKDKGARMLLLSSIPVLSGGLLEICNYLKGSTVMTTFLFFAGFILFMLLQVFWFVQLLQQQAQQTVKMEQELTNVRISTMLSQIQPHFLYNALVGIKQLCDTEPQKASEALGHFAYYLRINLYSISDPKLIPFEKEVEHVRDYLYLEKMRFEERVNVRMELSFTDFLLPCLTLQPMVENAVRHGITKKDGGGTITIKSEAIMDKVFITVTDDGVGFDMTAPPDRSRPHIGIDNVRKRLEIQCGGSLQIHSSSGAGTKVKITLPREEELHENTRSR